jgi:hypothetical protein
VLQSSQCNIDVDPEKIRLAAIVIDCS